MTSDMLSQDEIDALLKQGGGEEEEETSSAEIKIDDYLSPLEQDALGEIGNITFGSASTALSTLLGQKVDITTPKLSLLLQANVKNEFPTPHVAINVNYTEGFEGINLLVIKEDDAKVIADLMMGGDGTNPSGELNEIHISAVQEAMNQMMGSAATSMSTIFSRKVDISPPGIDILDTPNEKAPEEFSAEEVFIKVSFRMKIGDLIDSNIMQLFAVPFARQMVDLLMNPEPVPAPVKAAEPKSAPKPPPAPAAAPPAPSHEPVTQQPMYEQPVYQQPMYQQPPPKPNQLQANRSANVQSVQFSNFDQGAQPHADTKNLNLLLDIPLNVTVELGRTKRVIKDILELSPGSILELDKLAGEPVDILVNNKLIAKGEVVVIEENFGVRVTDILSQWDRLQKLQ